MIKSIVNIVFGSCSTFVTQMFIKISVSKITITSLTDKSNQFDQSHYVKIATADNICQFKVGIQKRRTTKMTNTN